MGSWLMILEMVINMNETRLRTIEQIWQFFSASARIEFSAAGDDAERYAHISRVLKRFDYPRCSKADRGLLRHYLQYTSGYAPYEIPLRDKRNDTATLFAALNVLDGQVISQCQQQHTQARAIA